VPGVPATRERGTLEEAIAEVEEQLGVVVGRARLVWKDAATQVHAELKPVGYKILSTIVRLGETNAYVLSDVLETDKSIVSRQVRMLEEAGLVISRADDKDRRAHVLAPTAAAIERVRIVRAQQQNRLRDLLRSRPEGDVRAFAAMLRLLSEG
jgi:DNA-binding MarR family transcriptional regulator